MLNLYCVRDKVADNVICSFTAPNDGLAVRENVVALSKVCPLGDLELVHVGFLDEKTLDVSSASRAVVSWDSYKFPETPLKPLKTEEKKIDKNN